jgi:flagellar hook protein FlgE
MSIQYKMDYEGDGSPRQVGTEIVATAAPRGQVETAKRRRRRIPSSVQTAITVVICGGIFFAAVRFAPEGWRPQDFTGEYVGDVAGEVKANEAAIQAQLDAYTNAVRAAVEQQNIRYNRVSEGIIQFYKASYDLNQTQVDAANRLRGAYAERQMAQSAQANGANLGIASIAELIGQGQNILDPGSGNAALAEAQRQRETASTRLENTAVEAANVDVSRYVNQLPSAEAIRRELESIPTIQLPPPPRFTREAN